MATSITPAPLGISITETITINGQSMGSQNNLTIADVTEVYKRIVSVPFGTEVAIYTTHDTVVGGSVFDDDLVKYVRVTNKDLPDGNFVTLRVTDANADEFAYKLNPGESFLLYSHDTSMSAALGATAGAVNANITGLEAQADTADVDCEIFVASI